MLSKHRVMSPATRRIAGGATLALAVIGLGITASGTEAAETLRGKVEDATGVEIASVEAQAAEALAPVAAIVPAQATTLPVVPAKPASPAPMPAPAEPAVPATAPKAPKAPMPMAIVMPATSGKLTAALSQGKVRKIVVQKFDGEGKLLGQSVSNIPEVSVVNANCGPGTQTSMTRKEGDKEIVTICSDRIRIVTRDAQFRAEQGAKLAALGAAQAARGEAQAAQGQLYARQGLRAALAGLRSSRASIAANQDMPAIARRSALEGIDDSIREIQSEIDSKD